ncbi:MAG: succinylglutamate desuccinylase/aspartoacylase family protein [Pseudomonadota bacterium]|nr:succinylglutamate desuccinylase/aspartoacylase family protein [Pseudomonadota bacterium]
MSSPPGAAALHPVDLDPFRKGNVGIDYVHRFESGRAGHDVVVLALVHGNEVSGAHALKHLFELGIRPRQGSLTLAFANVAAAMTYDPSNPTRARFIDEDMNRIWDEAVLAGARETVELRRARELLPVIRGADRLLDLHSMQGPGEALMLSGLARKTQDLAMQIGFPRLIVADAGHAAGLRLRDHGDFNDASSPRIALLAECGQHQDPEAAVSAREVTARFLHACGTIDRAQAEGVGPFRDHGAPRVIEVTDRVTIRTGRFRFVEDFQGLQVVPRAGTVIAHDSGRPVVTPYDECVLIMPSRRLAPGQTAVRLGRYVA